MVMVMVMVLYLSFMPDISHSNDATNKPSRYRGATQSILTDSHGVIDSAVLIDNDENSRENIDENVPSQHHQYEYDMHNMRALVLRDEFVWRLRDDFGDGDGVGQIGTKW